MFAGRIPNLDIRQYKSLRWRVEAPTDEISKIGNEILILTEP
jgi:hypothetical protein